MFNNLGYSSSILGYCLNCNSEDKGNILCDYCEKGLVWRSNSCFQCLGFCSCNISTAIPLLYNKLSSSLIMKFKYGAMLELATYFANYINTYLHLQSALLVPIPISRLKLFLRGYNQTVVLAEAIANIKNYAINYTLLEKNTSTTQRSKGLDERILNAASINLTDKVPKENIILVDDVIASGSTIKRAIDLIQPYALSITVAAIARV